MVSLYSKLKRVKRASRHTNHKSTSPEAGVSKQGLSTNPNSLLLPEFLVFKLFGKPILVVNNEISIVVKTENKLYKKKDRPSHSGSESWSSGCFFFFPTEQRVAATHHARRPTAKQKRSFARASILVFQVGPQSGATFVSSWFPFQKIHKRGY